MEGEFVDEKLNELQSKLAGNFNREEIIRIITLGTQLASYPVLSLVIHTLEEVPQTKKIARVIKKIRNKMPYQYSGYINCQFEETGESMNISLSLGPKDFRVQVYVPSDEYAVDVYKKYSILKDSATSFWAQFCQDNNNLFKKICECRSDVDFGELKVDPTNQTTLYFDPNSPKRVTIFAYNVDANGKPIMPSASTRQSDDIRPDSTRD